MDFSGVIPPTTIGTVSSITGSGRAVNTTGTITVASFAVTANQAFYVPVEIPWRFPVRRVFWINGSTVSTNADFGIYTLDGARLYSTGSTVQSGASVWQYVAANDLILDPGAYYFALVSSGTTNAFTGTSTVDVLTGRIQGIRQQASALPLPASATFAQWATTGLPICGISRQASGF